MGADAGFAPLGWRGLEGSGIVETVDSDASLVVVGGQQVVAAAVDGDVHGVAAEGDAVELFEVSVFGLDGESGEAVVAG